MNKKGFTLIELLAVIIILGIVMVITMPNLTDTFNKGKLKSEETFMKRLSQSIDSYIDLNTDTINFNDTVAGVTKGNTDSDNYKVYKGTKKIKDIMDDNIITNTDFINPNNKEVTCSIDAEIEVYRDSDYVYCHKVKVDALKCLSEDYRDKLAEDQKTNDPYAIDTCVWK